MSVGHIEQTAIAKSAAGSDFWNSTRPRGSHASGEIGRMICMRGSNIRLRSGDTPRRKPSGVAIAMPLGFLLGVSPLLSRMFDPLMQIMRPISPLAWLPLGLVLFQKSEPAALFAIAVCSMWPTLINTMVGVRAIPQDYWNVAKVLRLSKFTTFTRIIVPATLPYMFTGCRLSLGIAWLVIVASEMLTGAPGVGGFLWQEYNSLVYSHILLSIITIGVIGYLLDRLMGVAERRFQTS